MLVMRGHGGLPTRLYSFYNRTDSNILAEQAIPGSVSVVHILRRTNIAKAFSIYSAEKETEKIEDNQQEEEEEEADPAIGSQLVVEAYTRCVPVKLPCHHN